MSMRQALSDEVLTQKLTEKDVFKIKLSLSCLSNRVFVCNAVANLYIWQPPSATNPSNVWQYVRTGIPAIVVSSGHSGDRNPKGMYVCLVERQSGFCVWKESITANSNYREQQKNFHVMAVASEVGTMAGLRFADEDSAGLFYKDVTSNLDWILHHRSMPDLHELDLSHGLKEKSKKTRKLKKNEISSPCLFSHVTSITTATQVSDEVDSNTSHSDSNHDSKRVMNGHSKTSNIRRAFSMSKKRR
ncbi:predicted protein [Nematostella vectensis]|uniref:WH1 domain-containing protein n=1 Tax=Nematostella vectensis TaxID=45351 RepID=A8DUQ6_NEMVE|nr:uncharacterized protein LOC5498972 [Nematostella vectensis]EDO28521.1 predicted protein [Nematostella vectensis]|eukprot:XP_001620621.1 hypothetical protein NEMVEDRAFT_v1g176677 [Nematostella vectensis]